MGKKAKSTKGKLRATGRKLDKSTLPPPPKPVTDEVRILQHEYVEVTDKPCCSDISPHY
jgi:hypothetical protein